MLFYADDTLRPANDEGWTPPLPAGTVIVGSSPQAAVEARIDELVWPWHVWRVTPFEDEHRAKRGPWGECQWRVLLAVGEEVAPSACWGDRHERVPDVLAHFADWLTDDAFRAELMARPIELPETPEADLYRRAAERLVLSTIPPARLRDTTALLANVVAGALVALAGSVDREQAERLLEPAVMACVETGRLDALLG